MLTWPIINPFKHVKSLKTKSNQWKNIFKSWHFYYSISWKPGKGLDNTQFKQALSHKHYNKKLDAEGRFWATGGVSSEHWLRVFCSDSAMINLKPQDQSGNIASSFGALHEADLCEIPSIQYDPLSTSKSNPWAGSQDYPQKYSILFKCFIYISLTIFEWCHNFI